MFSSQRLLTILLLASFYTVCTTNYVLASSRSYSSWFGFSFGGQQKTPRAFSAGAAKSALPTGAIMRLGVNSFIQGDGIMIDRLQFSPKGTYLVSGSSFSTSVWHVRSGRRVLQSKGARTYAFSNDEKLFAFTARWSQSVPGTRRIQNRQALLVRNLETDLSKEMETTFRTIPNKLSFSDDGSTIIGSSFKKQYEWDTTTGSRKELPDLPTTGMRHRGIKSKDGSIFVWSPGQRKGKAVPIHVCDGKDHNRELFLLPGHDSGFLTNKVISSNNQFMVSAGNDGKFKLWDLKIGKLKQDLPIRHVEKANVGSALAISPDNKYIIGGRVRSGWHLWEVDSGRLIKHWPSKGFVKTVAISPDGKTIAYVHDHKKILFRNLKTGQKYEPASGHRAEITTCLVSADNKRVYSADQNGHIFEWSLEDGSLLRKIKSKGQSVYTMVLSPKGETLYWGEGPSIVAYNFREGKAKRVVRVPLQKVFHLAINVDGSLIAAKTAKGGFSRKQTHIRVYDTDTWQQISEQLPKGFVVTSPCFLGNEKIITGSKKTLTISDARSGKEIETFNVPAERYVNWVKVRPGSESDMVFKTGVKGVFTRSGGMISKLFKSIDSGRNAAQFAPKGPFLAAACRDNARVLPCIRFFDVERNVQIAELLQDNPRVTCVAFSPNGRFLVSGGDDMTLLVWDLQRVLN